MKAFLYKLFLGKPEYNQQLRRSAYFNYRVHIYKIWENASHNDIGFEKILRLFLVAVQILFPGLHYRNFWAKRGLAVRNVAIEFYVLFKTLFGHRFLSQRVGRRHFLLPPPRNRVLCIGTHFRVRHVFEAAVL